MLVLREVKVNTPERNKGKFPADRVPGASLAVPWLRRRSPSAGAQV